MTDKATEASLRAGAEAVHDCFLWSVEVDAIFARSETTVCKAATGVVVMSLATSPTGCSSHDQALSKQRTL